MNDVLQTENALPAGANFAGPGLDENKDTAAAVDRESGREKGFEKVGVKGGEGCIDGEGVGIVATLQR
jgi:hypothetical protein